MVNSKALASLAAVLDKWIETNSSEEWWTDAVGYIAEGTHERLALLVAVALEESKQALELWERENV